MRNERIDEIDRTVGTEVLQALEHVQLAFENYLHAIESLHNGIGKKGLQRPGAQARLRVLAQYAELLSVKLELALEPRQAADRLQYVLERRKLTKRTDAIHNLIQKLRNEPRIHGGMQPQKPEVNLNSQSVNRAAPQFIPPQRANSSVHPLSDPRTIRISIGSTETTLAVGKATNNKPADERAVRDVASSQIGLTPRTLNRPVIRFSVPEIPNRIHSSIEQTEVTGGRTQTPAAPGDLLSDMQSELNFSDNLMPRLVPEGRQATHSAGKVRTKPLLLNQSRNWRRSVE